MYFNTTHQLDSLIDAYFAHIAGEFHMDETTPAKGRKAVTPSQKIWTRLPEPPTISGLILFLGMESREVFDKQERRGKYAAALKRARLRIEAEYEKKLHQHTHGGAVFALKNLGWNDKDKSDSYDALPKTLKISIDNNPPPIAGTETEVAL